MGEAKKSGWAKVRDAALPIAGWGAIAGVLVLGLKQVTAPLPEKDTEEAKRCLLQHNLAAPSLEEDPYMYVLFRDIVTSRHAADQESLQLCGLALACADSLLKLESALRYEGIDAKCSDADTAKRLARDCLVYLEKIESAPTAQHFRQLLHARKRLSCVILDHLRAVECLALKP